MSGSKLLASPGAKVGLLLAAMLTLLAIAYLAQGRSDAPRVLEFAFAWWMALSFVAVQWGIGACLLELPVFSGIEGPGRGLLAISLGAFASAWLLALLGVLGLLNQVGLWIYLALSLTLAVRAVLLAWRSAEQPAFEAGAAPVAANFISRHPRLFWFGVLIFCLPYVLQTLLPDADWDAAQYHLPMATAFLDKGVFAADYALHAYFRPGTVQLFYSLMMLCDAEVAIIPLNLLALLISCGLCYHIAARTWTRAAGIWAVGILLSANIVLELSLDARVEPFLIWFFLAGCFGLFSWLHDRGVIGWLLLTACMAGMAAGCKYNGLIYAALLLAPLAFTLPAGRRMILSSAAVLLFAFPSGLWYARNAYHTGDPAYPLSFGPMNMDRDGELRRFGQELDRVPRPIRPPMRIDPHVQELAEKATDKGEQLTLLLLLEAVFDPQKYSDKPLHWLSPFLWLFFLLPLFDRRRASLLLFTFGLIAYGISSSVAPVVRYMAPLFPILAIGAGVLLTQIRQRWLVAIVALLLLSGLGYNSYVEYRKLSELDASRYLTAKESSIEYLQRVGYNRNAKALPKVIAWINAAVAAGEIRRSARIFMIGEGKGHRLRCGYQPSISAGGKEWLVELYNAGWDYHQLARNLWARNFRYLLVNRGWLDWNLQNVRVGKRRLTVTLHTLNAFLKDYAIIETKADAVTIKLYRLRDPRD